MTDDCCCDCCDCGDADCQHREALEQIASGLIRAGHDLRMDMSGSAGIELENLGEMLVDTLDMDHDDD